MTDDDLRSFFKQLITGALTGNAHRFLLLEHRGERGRMAVTLLLGNMIHNALNFVLRNESILHADRLWTPRGQIEHVAVPQQLIRTIHIKDGARIDF